MRTDKIFGFALLAIGMTLLGFAWQSTEAPLEQLTHSMMGRHRDETMWFVALGAAALVGGGLLALRGGKE